MQMKQLSHCYTMNTSFMMCHKFGIQLEQMDEKGKGWVGMARHGIVQWDVLMDQVFLSVFQYEISGSCQI